jgi:hypothetical protein
MAYPELRLTIIIQIIKGIITVESDLGKATVFTLVTPVGITKLTEKKCFNSIGS